MEDRLLPSPLYTTAARTGGGDEAILETIFVEHGVDVVFAGHEHATSGSSRRKENPFMVGGQRSCARATRVADRLPRRPLTGTLFMIVEIVETRCSFR